MRKLFMFYFLSFLIGFTNSKFSSSDAQELNRIHVKCHEILGNGITMDLLRRIASGERVTFRNSAEFPPHMLCVDKMLGFQDADGKLVLENVKANLEQTVEDKEQIKELMQTCVLEKSTPELTANDMFYCFINYMLQHGSKP